MFAEIAGKLVIAEKILRNLCSKKEHSPLFILIVLMLILYSSCNGVSCFCCIGLLCLHTSYFRVKLIAEASAAKPDGTFALLLRCWELYNLRSHLRAVHQRLLTNRAVALFGEAQSTLAAIRYFVTIVTDFSTMRRGLTY